MRDGCENKVVGNRLYSGEELGDSLFLIVQETCALPVHWKWVFNRTGGIFLKLAAEDRLL